ncbi:hypothetical protein KKC88_03355 [Patescibacteria group bacterium]|nr:hypothetical protein [Patescibacteria group bacterium]MBU1673829.1 hypothetical protein [Patescibacteria group bacterium]MBU1963614.1 hypothetical protein [Patescibacteria group bacterium]
MNQLKNPKGSIEHSIVAIIAIVLITIAIFYFNYYSLIKNHTNHTGFPVYVLVFIGILLAIGLLWGARFNRGTKTGLLFIIAAGLSMLLAINVFIFLVAGIMVPHDWTGP